MKAKLIFSVISLLLTISVNFAFAQNPEWVSFSAGSYIYTIVVEGNYIWVGTDGGLVKIDRTSGMTFYNTSNSGLPDNDVYAIAIDGQGNKWIGTWGGGVAKFDGVNWTVYNRWYSGLPSNYVRAIAIDGQGNKWIGTSGGGLAKFDGVIWTVYNTGNSGLPDNDVLVIAIDGQGNKWIGTYGGLAKFDGVNWTVYKKSILSLPDNRVYAIAIDREGNKWIGTGGGLAKFDGVSWTVYSRSNSGLPSDTVLAIAIDGQGNKWIGTDGGGLAKFDGVNWTVYNTSNSGLPSNYINAIAIDAMENKWIGTNGGGLVVYREGGVILVGKPIINVKTNNLNFGFGYLNVTKYNTLKVFNTGYDTLKITGIYTTDIRFRYEGGLPVVVLPGDSAGLVFSFRPNVSGEYVDTAVIVSNSSVNSNLKVALRGRGVKPPYISSSLDTLRFGRVFVSDSVSLSFKLYNSGEIDSVRIFRVEVNEPFYVETFSSLIGPGDSGVVRVKFKPISGGEFTSEMRIISNAWNDTFRVYVSGIASPVVVNSFRNVQSGVLKFVYRVRTVEVLNLTNFEYSTDGGSSWKVGSNISGRLNNITGDVIDTIYWDSRGNLSGYEGFVKVRFKFSSGTNDYFVNVDGVGVDNLAPRFEGVVSGSGDTNRVRLVWRRALDMSLIRYRIYYSANSGVYNFNNPAFEVSDTFAVVSGLENFRRYYFVVRAVDEFGNMDTNKVEISVIPGFRASITSLSVLSDKLSGDVRIVYKVNSVNGDSVGLRFYYSLDGGVNWFSSVNLIGGDRKITSFPHTDTLVWRSKLDTMVETNRCVVKIVPGGRGGTGDEMRSGEFTLDNLAPRFGGIKSGVNLPFNKVVLKWDEAIDISKPLRYKIFVSSTGQFDFTKPYAETDKDSVLVSELETSRSYYFVVKVSDAFGQETSSGVYTMKVNALCDYNGDNRVDAFDVGRYVSFWTDKNYSASDIYPYDGQIPYVVVRGDGKLNVDDIFTFTKMWDYSRISGLPKVAVGFDVDNSERKELKVRRFDEFIFRPDVKGRFISYGFEIRHKGVRVMEFTTLRDGICLVYRDSLNDVIYFDYAKIGGIDEVGDGLFRMRLEGGDSVIVKFVAYDESSIESGKSSYEVEYVLKFEEVPREYALYQNYPNPFNPVTVIKFDLPEKVYVRLVVYDVVGRLVKVLCDGEFDAGRHSVSFDGSGLSSGVYFYRIEAGRFVKVMKMLLMK